MRTSAMPLRLTFLILVLAFAGIAVAAEDQLPILEVGETPANWTAPPFWVPPAPVREIDAGGSRAAASRTALTSTPPALPFFAVTPCRLADTRSSGGVIGAAQIRNFQITGACGIPAQAKAVSFNFTVTDTQGQGFLVAYPQGGAFPTVSTLNFVYGQTVGNAAIVPLSAGGGISAAMGVSGADLIIDVNGYFAPTGIVASVNNLTGDVSLAAGSNVTVTPSGNTLTIAAPLTNLNASNVTSGVLGISFGGTGATTPAGARQAFGAAASGSNTDITSLANLTTPLSIAQGGTGTTTASAGRLALGAAASGANTDITSLMGLTTPLLLSKGGTGSTTAAGARAALGAASGGANGDITSLSNLTTPLSIAQGGTGTATPFTSAFQARITGTCSVGSYVVSVSSGGAVSCASPVVDPRPGYSLTILASSLVAGLPVAMTVGADGRGLIAFYDTTPALKIAHCVDLGCTGVTTAVVESPVSTPNSSVVIGADGLPLIVYSNGNKIKTAHCNDVACTSSTTATLRTLSGSSWPSITIGTNGLGMIAYVDGSLLAIMACTNAVCSASTLPLGVDGASVFAGASITVGADGSPLVSYSDAFTYNLKVARCSDPICSSASIASAPGSGFVVGASIAVGSDGRGLVSFQDAWSTSLKTAHCDDARCSSLSVSTLEVAGFIGNGTSLTIGPDGLGLIVRTGWNLGVAHCQDAACSTASMSILENSHQDPPAITIGADGLALVAWDNQDTGRLEAAHCGTALCLPYVRRR